jgi:hypothetical protein
MIRDVLQWVLLKLHSTFAFLRTTFAVLVFPPAIARKIRLNDKTSVYRAWNYFATSLGLAISIEGVFSFLFKTDFVSIYHYAFPVIVSVPFLFLFLLFVRAMGATTASWRDLTQTYSYVAGSGLFVLVSCGLGLITILFLVHAEKLKQATCDFRSIFCLISASLDVLDTGVLASYVIPSVVVLVGIYGGVFAYLNKRLMSVGVLKTITSSIISIAVLFPIYAWVLPKLYDVVFRLSR